MSREPLSPTALLSWSLRVGSVAGVEVRLHWTLLLITAFEALRAISAGLPWAWLPVLLLIPILSVLLHEFGHVTAARLAGGHGDRIVLWMLGGLALCSAPMTPGRQFFVAAAGPAVNAAIAAIGLIILGSGPFIGGDAVRDLHETHGALAAVIGFAVTINLWLLLFNLLPCYPLDGGRMLRAGLWPLIGLRRAALASIWTAYVVFAGLFVFAALHGMIMLLLIVVLGVMAALQEHQLLRMGFDPYLGETPIPGDGPGGGGWWERRRRRRAAARAERIAAEEAAEQEVLDRLLEKVTAHGLPSLTAAERTQLQRISARQRERAGG